MIEIGILSPAEIAYRRFLPALLQSRDFHYVGLGIYSEEERFGGTAVSAANLRRTMEREREKGNHFVGEYGGKLWTSYEKLVVSKEVNALYIPLPPALHFPWAHRALEEGKHVLVEKPFTISVKQTLELVSFAKRKKLALHENYMFLYHSQLEKIRQLLNSGKIGDVRLYSMRFGFPQREKDDFRYVRALGGGALLDAGGYALRLAYDMLGESIEVKHAVLNFVEGFEVDMYGSAVLENDKGITAQVAFGMDNGYKCELEVWGSKGSLITNRVYTAPADYAATAIIKTAQGEEIVELGRDDAFLNSIGMFYRCVTDETVRQQEYKAIIKQAELVEQVFAKAER